MSLGTNRNWNIGMVTSVSDISIYLFIGWSSEFFGILAWKKFSTGRKNPNSVSCTRTAKDLLDSADGCPISGCLILASGSSLYGLWCLYVVMGCTSSGACYHWFPTRSGKIPYVLHPSTAWLADLQPSYGRMVCQYDVGSTDMKGVEQNCHVFQHDDDRANFSLVTSSIGNHNKRWCSKLKHSLHVLIWVTYKTQQKQGDKVQPSTAAAPNDSDLAQAPSTPRATPTPWQSRHLLTWKVLCICLYWYINTERMWMSSTSIYSIYTYIWFFKWTGSFRCVKILPGLTGYFRWRLKKAQVLTFYTLGRPRYTYALIKTKTPFAPEQLLAAQNHATKPTSTTRSLHVKQ